LYGASVNSILKIFDVEGKIIFESKIKSAAEKILFNSADGIYFLETVSENKIQRSKILIKKP
jgi:hypothetical protein